MEPEALQLSVIGVGTVRVSKPLRRSGDHVGRRASGQFDPRAITGAVIVALQNVEQLLNWLPRDRRGLHQRTPFGRDAVDAAIGSLATGVSQVVLHVADDWILPINKVERAIRRGLHVHGAKIWIGREEDRFGFFGRTEARILILHLVIEDALEADHVLDEQVPLKLFGEVRPRQVFDRGTRAGSLLVDARRAAVLVREFEIAGEERRVIRHRARPIDDDVLTPCIEGMSVRVGEAVGDVDIKLLRSRFVAEDRAILHAARWTPRRFDLCLMERSLLEVDRSARIEDEAVRRVMRVGRVEAMDQPLLHVVLVVAVGVLEEHEARPLSHEDASAPELEAGDVVQVSGKRDALVRAAVVVGVLKNQQAVVHRRGRLPVRIRRPRRHPQSALRVEGHLLRTDQFGELCLVGKALNLQPLLDRHLRDRFLTRQEEVLAIGQRPRLVRDDVEEFGQSAIVRLDRLPLSRRPHDLVPVRGERVEDFQFALSNRVVR